MNTASRTPVFTQVGLSLPHESAHLHVAGAAPYTDDIPEAAGTLHAALGLSPLAHGVIEALDLDFIRALPGVVAVLSARDIPGANQCGALVPDEPILAGEVGSTLSYLCLLYTSRPASSAPISWPRPRACAAPRVAACSAHQALRSWPPRACTL